ncbi:DUF397 domain-containing protein [Streptomyces sp. RS10V-4]|uniref:DUF397 domain-containing protein n=1 Tax=Streptomyces rhizoryzae TaxID=2932493 RepID=UPI00200554D0|nr:DUF397 domain-containing protein [Streptomyces rhizoryzae]MCK7627170.1 DUF397 domain-containing protein [Streptomyces rhizoryzae]
MSADLDLTAAHWIKSSYSDANGGNCLEFSPSHAAPQALVPVRDSKVPGGPVVVVSVTGWSSFVAAVKNEGFAAV